jgi:hypothetical protein
MEAVVDDGQDDGKDEEFADAEAEVVEDEEDVVEFADCGVFFLEACVDEGCDEVADFALLTNL